MGNNDQLNTKNTPENPPNPIVVTYKPIRKQRSDKGKKKPILQEAIQPSGEIDHFTKTPEAKAMFKAHTKHIRSNNKMGMNQYSLINNMVPYPLKYAVADALLKDGKTVSYVRNYTGLSREIIIALNKGKIDLLSKVVNQVKEHETQNLVMLGNSILDRISEKDVENASLLQKTTSYCQLLDKRRLLQGETTENVGYLGKLDILVNGSNRAGAMLNKLETGDKQ